MYPRGARSFDPAIRSLFASAHRPRTVEWILAPLSSVLLLIVVPSWAKPDDPAPNQRHVRTFLDAEFEEDTESRHRALDYQNDVVAKRVENVLSDFVDIGGYFRAGYGRSGRGGPLTAFQAPGAPVKYRLGNEAENYGELIIGKNIYIPGVFQISDTPRPSGIPSGPVARVQLRMSFFNPYDAHSSAARTQVGLPEAWAAIGNVLDSQPSAKFWAGVRFYRRHDIHLDDFFFWNMSGGGGGIEDVQVGPVKMAFAWIGLGSTSGLSYLPEPNPENRAGFSKSNFDLRFYELPLLGGVGEMGVVFSYSQSGLDSDGNQMPESPGVGIHFVHTKNRFLSTDGSNKFSIQYGTAAAKTFTSGFETFSKNGDVYIRPDEPGSWRLRVTESFVASPSKYFSVGPVLIAQATKYDPGQGSQYWLSAGVRPIIDFNKHINLAFEGGLDWVRDDELDQSGVLYKFTVAPQVAIDRLFMSRPVIRAFFTYAKWSDAFEGQIGGLDYASETAGTNWGMQMEAWW